MASASAGVPLDELVGDRIEVVPDVVGLRADVQRRVALTEDEPGLPAGREGTQRVPGVAGDQADVARSNPGRRAGHRVVGLWRRLVAPYGLIDAEAALEQVDDARVLQLPA